MIKSKFIVFIFDLLLDYDDAVAFKKQVPYLSETDIEYTGVGAFISFSHTEEIYQHRVETDAVVFDGVWINSKELTAESEAMVHIKDGIIDYIEIWSFDGNYPKKELETYELKQVWQGSPEKVITVPANACA